MFSYVLICKQTRQLKKDGGSGVLLIFDTVIEARGALSQYNTKSEVEIVKCEMEFSNKETLS